MKFIFSLILVAPIILFSCKPSEPADGKGEYDSLFLGFYFGMDKKEFFDYCWKMNKERKFIHGPTNQNVEYLLKDEPELNRPVFMRFYPFFYNEKIYQMPVTFSYDVWAPWNREYYAEKLLPRVVTMLSRWHEVEFESKERDKNGKIYAAIQGNRRISIFVKDEQFVQVVYTDIPAEKLARKKLENLQGDKE